MDETITAQISDDLYYFEYFGDSCEFTRKQLESMTDEELTCIADEVMMHSGYNGHIYSDREALYPPHTEPAPGETSYYYNPYLKKFIISAEWYDVYSPEGYADTITGSWNPEDLERFIHEVRVELGRW